jgi:Family of unknown function (DUF6199)
MFALIGVLMVIFGIVSLAAGDLMWSLTELGNSWNGRASERTDLWETRRMIGGVVAIALGIVVILIGLSQH